MASRPMELQVVCSSQVKKNAATWVTDTVPWTVDATKPFADEVNFGRLCSTLNIYTVCELCHYSEGVVGSIVDHTKTPEELGYRPRMQIYLRLKKQTKAIEDRMTASLGVKLTEAEEMLLRKLRAQCAPNLAPEEMCPLCTRTLTAGATEVSIRRSAVGHSAAPGGSPVAASVSGAAASAAPGGGGVAAGAAAGTAAAPATFGAQVFRPEVGVQCGNAGRINEAPVDVAFGTAARFRDVPRKAYGGAPCDFPPASTLGGAKFVDFDDTVVDLKTQLEAVQRERDQLRMELREVTRQKTELEHWKLQHRCEVSADVAKVRQELEVMQCNMRDLMRGREDAFALLQQRRTAGSTIGDAPYNYAPFATNIPTFDSPVRDPHLLLSKDAASLRNSTVRDASDPASLQQPQPGIGDFSHAAGTGSPEAARTFNGSRGIELQRRPSGNSVVAAGSAGKGRSRTRWDPSEVLEQAPGQCLLRVASVAGEPFTVKRKLDSYVRNRKNVFALLSLDDVVTDEIFVEELEVCRTVGESELQLATRTHQWALHMSPGERQRWLHWMYALNPWLSTTPTSTGVPNSY